MKRSSLRIICTALTLVMLLTLASVNAFAANSPDANIIKKIEITGVHTPYAGYRVDYGSNLGSTAYTYDTQSDFDKNVYDGKWWYDETTGSIVKTSDTFIKGHVYTFTVLLAATEGNEFWVDNYNTPFISATVNGETATVYDELTSKKQACVEYTFEPCDYNYEIKTVTVNIEAPVAGGYPTYDVEILTPGVVEDTTDSPDYIGSVAWYDCVNQTFLDPSHTFKEDGIYEVNIALTTVGDYYFATDNNYADVKAVINGKEGESNTSGKNDAYHIRVSCVVFGDTREEVEYLEILGITSPVAGAHPDFTATPVGDAFYINAIYWTDVTKLTTMKETDTFEPGHTYRLEAWIKTNENYKFCMNSDGYIDIMALLGGYQADVSSSGTETAAELSVTYIIPEDNDTSSVPLESEIFTDPDEPASSNPDTSVPANSDPITSEPAVSEPTTSATDPVETTNPSADNPQGSDPTEPASSGTEENPTTAPSTDVTTPSEPSGSDASEDEISPSSPSSDDETNPSEPSTVDEPENPSTGDEPDPSDPENPSTGDGTKPSEPEDSKGILGDVNGDGKVNIKDATQIQKFSAKLMELTEAEALRADVTADTKVNIKDATAIQKYVAKIDTGLPIGLPL